MSRRATVLAIATAKGGVGKTALAVNLASTLARGERVVIVDLDVQADCTSGLGIRRDDSRNDDGAGLFAALTTGSPLGVINTRWVDQYGDNTMVFERERLALVAGGEVMSGFLPWAVRKDGDDTELAAALEPLRGSADWIILDTPPTDEWTQRQALRVDKIALQADKKVVSVYLVKAETLVISVVTRSERLHMMRIDAGTNNYTKICDAELGQSIDFVDGSWERETSQ